MGTKWIWIVPWEVKGDDGGWCDFRTGWRCDGDWTGQGVDNFHAIRRPVRLGLDYSPPFPRMARPRVDVVQLHEYDGQFEFQLGTIAFRLVREGPVWALYAQGASERLLYESFNEAMNYALESIATGSWSALVDAKM